MRKFVLVLCSILPIVVMMPASPAVATFPGGNGRIAFYLFTFLDSAGPGPIVSMNPDGTDRTVLVAKGKNWSPAWSSDGTKIAFANNRKGLLTMNGDGTGRTLVVEANRRLLSIEQPSWSPDGTRIAFDCFARADESFSIFIVNADGTGLERINGPSGDEFSPDWSPDGSRIVFDSFRGGGSHIMTMDPDGGNRVDVTTGTFGSWSPDSSQLAFVDGRGNEVFVVNADGTGRTRLTHTSRRREYGPVFSPDGTKIAYSRSIGPRSLSTDDIWIMNTDGSSPTQITDTPRRDEFGPSWQAT